MLLSRVLLSRFFEKPQCKNGVEENAYEESGICGRSLKVRATNLRAGGKMKRTAYLVTILVFFVTISGAWGSVPGLISYQGIISDSEGNPITDTLNLTFTIYDDSLLSNPENIIWQETHLNVGIINGLFQVIFGRGTPEVPISDEAFAGAGRWLGIRIQGGPEQAPRTRFTCSPYSDRVGTIDGASGGAITGDVTLGNDLNVNGQVQGNLTVNGEINSLAGENKIAFRYNTLGELPDATAYDGMFAKVQDKSYCARGGQWVQLIDYNNPASRLAAADGSPIDALNVDNSGNVGIGASSSGAKLYVQGDVRSDFGGYQYYMVPRGGIIMWSGAINDIPTGWALCDGTNATPDLRNRFIMACQPGENPGSTGGASSHHHTVDIGAFSSGISSHYWRGATLGASDIPDWNHYHSVNPPPTDTDSIDNIPPYYKLAFIMKL